MNTDNDRHRTRASSFFKWLLFGLELFLLWMLFNTIFVVPGWNPGKRIKTAVVLAILSAVAAWASGRMFGGHETKPFVGNKNT